MTGVERYAIEVIQRLNVPHREERPPFKSGGAAGHLWEQFALPVQSRGRLLWSPCNTGPIRHPRQVVTIHDAAFSDRRDCFSPRFAAWYNWLLPRLARAARRVITVSEFSKSRIVDACGVRPDKIDVIYNGVDRRFCPPGPEAIRAMRQHLGLEGDYVLGVGSLEPRKNLAGLLAAWSLARRKHPALQLAIAGCASDARFRDSGIGDADLTNVRLLGYVPDAHLPSLYGGALAFAYPSLYEGFGLPPLEAMACGTPVVCSGTTSLPEVVGDAAELVTPTDPGSIADGMLRILDSSRRAEALRQMGSQQAAGFTWERTAEQTQSALMQVATET